MFSIADLIAKSWSVIIFTGASPSIAIRKLSNNYSKLMLSSLPRNPQPD
jgi:hypothetical protein